MHCQSGLHDGEHDLVKSVELARAVHAGGFHDLHGEAGVQILLHEEEDCRGRNAGHDQRNEAVLQPHLGDELEEAQRRHLRRHGHNEQDDGERRFLEFEVVGVDAVGRQGRKVDAEGRRAGRNDEAVADTRQHRDVGIGQHVFKVRHQRFARQQGEAFLDLEVGTGGVDDQNVEEEQAQEAEED